MTPLNVVPSHYQTGFESRFPTTKMITPMLGRCVRSFRLQRLVVRLELGQIPGNCWRNWRVRLKSRALSKIGFPT